jgi:hypothetical protein
MNIIETDHWEVIRHFGAAVVRFPRDSDRGHIIGTESGLDI